MRRVDPRDQRIAELEAQLGNAAQEIACLHETAAKLKDGLGGATEEIARLQARIEELEARLGCNSLNSSRPPSSDSPETPPPHRRPRSKRRRGGQEGHQAHHRPLLPPERISKVHDVKPTACRRCLQPLEGTDPDPLRHQVIDLPKVQAMAIEYRRHSLWCERCRIRTTAELPPGVPWGNFGPRVTALVGVLAGAYRLPQRLIQQILADLFDLRVSLGSVAKQEARVSEAVQEPVQQVAEYVQQQPMVHADETGWTEAKKKAWLWVVVTAHVALFLIDPRRGAQVAKKLLGKTFGGILHSDRWSAYNWVDTQRRQLCWAHLRRQFIGFQDFAKARWLGEALDLQCRRMFRLWHRVRDGTLDRATFQQKMRPIERKIVALLREGMVCPVAKVAGRCREILKLEQALFTFVRQEGVEPTNNAAERALRHAVLWRKGCFGTDSYTGSRFVERILTVVTTLRLQNRNVLEWVTRACEARLHHQPAPSLLPDSAPSTLALSASLAA